MDFSIKNISKSEKEIKVIISSEELRKYMEKALDSLAQGLRVKGFRQGKVPKNIAEKEIGQKELLQEASALAIQESYVKILKEHNFDILGQPKVEIIKIAPGNPFEFKIILEILPQIELPDYKKIAKNYKQREVFVEEKEVDQAFEKIQAAKDNISEEQKKNINLDNTEELKEMIRNQIKIEKDIAEKQRVRNNILKEISENCSVDVPEVLIQAERLRAMSEIKNNVLRSLNMSFEDYLKKSKKTEKELEESLIPEIKERIKRFLILREIEKRENIKTDDKEIEKEVEIFLSQIPENEEKNNINREELNHYFKEKFQQEKTLQFLEELSREE